MRVVQHTVQQIDVDPAVAFRAGSSHPHPAFRAGYRLGYIHPHPGFATLVFARADIPNFVFA
eukprot:13635273-Heterocapsa_arctica.AAC.1